ncbi:MAG: hypothetical protein WD898_02110 [Candidatus Paceibacterota bacterium]
MTFPAQFFPIWLIVFVLLLVLLFIVAIKGKAKYFWTTFTVFMAWMAVEILVFQFRLFG